MIISGKLEVEKWLHNTAVESFNTLELLISTNSRVGTIGLYNGVLYYRASTTMVLPLVTVSYLENVISNLNITGDIVNNILNDVDFINSVISSVLDSILNNNQFINTILNSILAKANVEVRSLKGKTLFFAFDPNGLDGNIPPELPAGTGTCSTPTGVTLVGNFTPSLGATETYDIIVTGSSEYLLTYSVIGGVVTTSVHQTPIQVVWDIDFKGLSSISVGVGCSNDIPNSKYDFRFFTLEEKISSTRIEQDRNNNAVEVVFKYGTTKQQALLSSENISFYIFGNVYQINDIIYSDNLLQNRASTGFYLKNSEYLEVVNGVIIAIDNA